MHIHSGVAFRLLAGLLIMAILAVSASLIGHFAVDGYKEPFRQTANIDLPNLVATSQLAQDAVSLTANAPALVLAKSQEARHAAMTRIEGQIESMKSLVNRFAGTDIATDTVQYVVKQGAILIDNLKTLNHRIDQRIELQQALAQALISLRALEHAIAQAAAPADLDTKTGTLVRDWQLAAQHTLILVALAANAAQPDDYEALRTDIGNAISETTQRLARVPREPARSLESLNQRLETLSIGDDSPPKLRSQRFAADQQIGLLMNRNKVLSDEMAALVASVASSIEGNALSRSAMVIQSSERHSLWLMISALICVVSAIIIIGYLNLNVIRRLRELVACMMNAVKGDRHLAIPIGSNDEIGELARAFQFFVETIDTREAALQASERHLATIINLLPDATLVIDQNGKVLFWNRAMEAMTGVPASEMVGRDNYEYALPFYGARRPILIDMALKTDAFIPGAYSLFQPHGDSIWAETNIDNFRGQPISLRGSASVVRDATGAVVGAIELIFDITDRRKMIDDLSRAKDIAERASQDKSMFLATMSHELRTPLNSIIAFADFVSSEIFGPVGDKQYLEHAEYAHQSAHQLLEVINSILDLSKIEAGMMELDPVRVPVATMLTRSTRIVQELAVGAGVAIKVVVPSNIPDLWADERAMRQIMINLLSNAIKFNVNGGSILVAALEAGDVIEIVVADTGAGIPTDDLERVLKPFEQIDNQYSRALGGTGLGLSIVAGLVTLQGGTLTLASAVGKGTAITLRIPRAPKVVTAP